MSEINKQAPHSRGDEPEQIRKKLDRLFSKLNEIYPDYVIVSLHKDHKELGERVTNLYRLLGYPDGRAFLQDYGYTVKDNEKRGGQSKGTPEEFIAELHRRYPEGVSLDNVTQLAAENPDMAQRFKTMANRWKQLFGVSLTDHLVREGILTSDLAIANAARRAERPNIQNETQLAELIATLEQRYESKDKPTSFLALVNENPDLPISNLSRVTVRLLGIDALTYLVHKGIILKKSGITDEQKLAAVEKALTERYSGATELPQTVAQIKKENSDLNMGGISRWVENVKGITVKEWFASLGILPTEKTPEEKLEEMLSVLKERYIGTDKKAYSLYDLTVQNQDLSITDLKKLIKTVHSQAPDDYLLSLGILKENERMIKYRKEQERIETAKQKQREGFMNDLPFDELYRLYADSYRKQTVDNPNFDLPIPEETNEQTSSSSKQSGDENNETTADGFVLIREMRDGKPYVILKKYIGSEEIVKVPDGVNELGWWSLDKPGIRQVIIPESTVHLSRDAFSSDFFKNAADPDGFCIVGKFLLDYSGSSSVVTIPDGVEVINRGAFSENKTITEVYLPKSIKVIGNLAFLNCENLTAVVFHEETAVLDRIEYGAFSGCQALRRINLPKTVRLIEQGAFSRCQALRRIDPPETIGRIGEDAFANSGISADPDGFLILCHILVKYTGSDRQVTVPDGVTVIGENAFYRCENLTQVDLKNAERIDNHAFSGCKNLTQINLEHVTHIGENAFYRCEKLTQVNLENVERIGNSAFSGCKNLARIDLENTIHIGSNAFYNCEKLTQIDLQNVSHIGDEAFSSCRNLKQVDFGNAESIGKGAFDSCAALTEVFLPGSVKSIGDNAFRWCTGLREVVISEGTEEIGKDCFLATKAMERLTIPSTVKTIGKDAFFDCKCRQDIKLPPALAAQKSYFGIPDPAGCFIENGVLVRCHPNGAREVTIPDGVVVIGPRSLDNAFSHWGDPDVERITLPDTVRLIQQEKFEKASVNIPCGYLLQKTKLPVEPLKVLLSSTWSYSASMLDWVSVFVYQGVKQLNEYCIHAFKIAPNAFVAAALVIFSGGCKPSEVDRVGEVVYDLKKKISQESLDKFFAFASTKKAKKTIAALTPFVSSSVGGELNKVRVYANETEEYCAKHFEQHALERVMKKAGLSQKLFQNSGVRYEGKDEQVSAFVLECAVVPYIGSLTERPRNIGSYRTEFCYFDRLKKCDRIAEQFDKTSFAAFIAALADSAHGYDAPQIWIPVCRFGSGDQVKALISSMKGWSDWYRCGVSGRSAIMVCRGAIMLSDTREAMMYADKEKCLYYYAKIRGTTEDVIRDSKLADFGFDSDGKKRYDLGSTVIEATIGNDLKITLFDTAAAKVVKSLPKRGSDPAKYDACAADYAELKKNVKKVVKARNDLLFAYFLSGQKFDAASWIASYTKNTVLNKVARLLVWAQGKQTFTLDDTGAVDSSGNSIVIDENKKIVVAHPVEMDDTDIIRWQKFFTERNLKQPFEQVWEPKFNGGVAENRYAGVMIPYYRLLNQEKHGITVVDNDFHNEINIYLDSCDATIDRIDWRRHDISVNDRFEIKSIRINSKNRRSNHVIYYLDKCTIYGKLERDEVESLPDLNGYTAAQISAFLSFSIEHNAVKCTATLLDYKNEHFADFSAMDEFTLDL